MGRLVLLADRGHGDKMLWFLHPILGRTVGFHVWHFYDVRPVGVWRASRAGLVFVPQLQRQSERASQPAVPALAVFLLDADQFLFPPQLTFYELGSYASAAVIRKMK